MKMRIHMRNAYFVLTVELTSMDDVHHSRRKS